MAVDVDELLRQNGSLIEDDAFDTYDGEARVDLDVDTDGMPPLVEVPPKSGEWLEMQLQGDLSITDAELYRRLTIRIDEEKNLGLDDENVMSEEQQNRMDALEIQLCQIILPDASRAQLKSLGRRRRARLMQRFFEESRKRALMKRARRIRLMAPIMGAFTSSDDSSETTPNLSPDSGSATEEPTTSGETSAESDSASTP